MPPLPGEDRLLTVFADIHYCFTAPNVRPVNDRFEKGCYLYIYYHAGRRKARIEVANNPGSPEQDAFNGALDRILLQHATRFPTRCTLTVDGYSQGSVNDANAPSSNAYEWRLQNSNRESQRLHTLDVYFWTLDDANQFLNSVEAVLFKDQIETDRHITSDNATVANSTTVSSVVQKLETVAITDPAYQTGQATNSASEPTSATSADSQDRSRSNSSLTPPSSIYAQARTPSAEHRQPMAVELPADERKEPVDFTPLAYNPGAPAAPEPIKHREKTPPPIDAADGTGLAAAAKADHAGLPYTHPGQYQNSMPTGYASPPPSAGLTHIPSLLSHPSSFHTAPAVAAPTQIPPYSPPPPRQATFPPASQPGSMSFAPPPQDPNAHLYGQQYHHHHHHQHQLQYHYQQYYPQHFQHQYPSYAPPATQPQAAATTTATTDPLPPVPIGGYANSSYNQPPPLPPPIHRNPSISTEYDIHSQICRPTETEARSKHVKNAMKHAATGGQQQQQPQRSHKLEQKIERVESRVNSFLKRLENI